MAVALRIQREVVLMATQEQPESASSAYMTSTEDGEPVSQTVLEAVAELSNRAIIPDSSTPEGDVTSPLPPLYEAVDPDALNRICQSATDETEILIRFRYCGYDVSVKNGDEIIVCET
jgi:hypothetical protein